jgi:hypothetical protein
VFSAVSWRPREKIARGDCGLSVERFNLSSRMQMRRLTRLSNGFLKKLESHCAAVALWVSLYNVCRVHETLRMTPAMALGVTDLRAQNRDCARRAQGLD